MALMRRPTTRRCDSESMSRNLQRFRQAPPPGPVGRPFPWEILEGQPLYLHTYKIKITWLDLTLITKWHWRFFPALKDVAHDSHATVNCKVSQLVPTILKTGRAFYQILGLRKGDTTQTYLPNMSSYYFPIFGTIMCQAVASMADPSLKVLI